MPDADPHPEPGVPPASAESQVSGDPGVLDDLRAYADADAATLEDLTVILDALRRRASDTPIETFDRSRIWERVHTELFRST